MECSITKWLGVRTLESNCEFKSWLSLWPWANYLIFKPLRPEELSSWDEAQMPIPYLWSEIKSCCFRLSFWGADMQQKLTDTCCMNHTDMVGKTDSIHVIATGITTGFQLVPFDLKFSRPENWYTRILSCLRKLTSEILLMTFPLALWK